MDGFPGAPADVSQLEATMLAVEHACSLIQMHVNPQEAEQVLVLLRKSSMPYQSCQYILEYSQSPNARFQAASAISLAALREWGILTEEKKISLILYCLQYAAKHANAEDAYVQSKVSASAAQLMKRGWIEFAESEKSLVLSQVKQAVVGAHGVDAQVAGISFLEALVSEFSLLTSSSLGFPKEFHVQCQTSLESYYLKEFYCWANVAAFNLTDNIIGCNASLSEDKACSLAMRLMFQILNWNFIQSSDTSSLSKFESSQYSPGIRHGATLLKKFERTLVQPGYSWRDPLISGGLTSWILNFYGALRQKYSHDAIWLDSSLAVSARNLIVQLCSLTGTIFPSDNGHTQINHLLQILSSILQWVEPGVVTEAIRSGRSESEFIDGCHALLSIATLTTPTLFDSLVHSLRSFGTIHFMYLLTSDVLKANIADHDEEETWMTEAFDILLETWTVVFGSSNGDESSVSAEGKSAAAKLFTCIVEFLRKVAAETAYGEDDHAEYLLAAVSKRDERLESYAIIGRAAADVTIPYLFSVFSQCTSHLNQIIGKSDPTCILEELYWILLIIGHVLTDSGEGETIIIPEALQVEYSDFLEEAQHPVVLLSWSIIDFASQSLDPERRAACFSPRLMESIIWFLARWVETYLMPADSSKESTTPKDEVVNLNGSQSSKRILLNFAGEHKQGDMVLDIVTRICIAVLNSYPGENELQALTCQKLLVALVRRRNVCIRLLAMNSWQDLARAFSKERILLTLGSRLQRDLAKVFVSAASSLNDPQASNQYVMDLIESTTLYLMEISARNDLNDVAQLPDTMYMIICLLERLIGMAKATQPRTQKAIFEVGATVMKSLITLLKAYNNQPAVVYLIIRFVVDLVDGQIAYLDAKDTSLLVTFCLQLLQIYSSQNIRKMSLSHSSGLHCAAQDEKYKDLRALLQLLTNLCSKELIDFSPDEDGSPGIPEVIFFGLHIVSAMISLELLQYPKLSHCYFRLLSHMLEVYPEIFSQLKKDAFVQVVAALDVGIEHQDVDTVDMCLRAINALASYHFREQAVGRGGLPTHMVDSSCPDGRIQENICSHFLRLLVQLVLYEDFRMDLAGSAADALLPLLLCNQNTYQSLVQEFLDKLPLPSLRPRLAAAFHSLTSSNKLSTSLDRPNLIRFRKNFREFLTEISGLRIK